MRPTTRHKVELHNAKDWRLAFANTIWSGLIVIAIVVLSRRAAGAFQDSLSPALACTIAFIATMASLVANAVFQSVRRVDSRKRIGVIAGIVTLVPPTVLGIVVLPQQSSLATAFLVSLFVLASIVVLFCSDFAHESPYTAWTDTASVNHEVTSAYEIEIAASLPTSDRQPQLDASGKLEDVGDASISIEDEEHSESEDSTDTCQWMTRRIDDVGNDTIEGSIKVQFEVGQKQVTLHLPFSPAFATRPDVECEVVNDCSARLKIAAIQAYGIRVDVRRSSDIDQPETAEIGFCATAAATRKAEAA